MTPRVVAFVHGELGRHALSVLGDRVVAAVIGKGCDLRHGPFVDTPAKWAWIDDDDPQLEAMIADLNPTHGVSAGFRSIIRPRIINRFRYGIANFHTSYLPLGRGANPNAWAIFADQEAGVTMHLIDEGVDTGPILGQIRVEKFGHDTAKTLWERLQIEAKRLISDLLPAWIEKPDEIRPVAQPVCHVPTRRKKDLEELSIRGDATYHGWELMNILRARTFPPYQGALYTAPDGKRYRVTIVIQPDA
ncbi:MAG: hypothetical protein H0X45_08345 [Planctomycetes bacterium]|nr:hypothetical protein [Planctomycetota bacterium]